MKLTLNLLFAFAMMLSLAFLGDVASSNNPLSVKAQQVTVKKKSRRGIIRTTAHGAKFIYRKGRNGVVYIYRKTAHGTVYVGKKTAQGVKWVGKKSYKTGRKVVSRTKKIVY